MQIVRLQWFKIKIVYVTYSFNWTHVIKYLLVQSDKACYFD